MVVKGVYMYIYIYIVYMFNSNQMMLDDVKGAVN